MKYNLTKLGRSDNLLAAAEGEWLVELNTVSVKESNSRFHIIWQEQFIFQCLNIWAANYWSPSRCGFQSRELAALQLWARLPRSVIYLSRAERVVVVLTWVMVTALENTSLLSYKTTFVCKRCWFIWGRVSKQISSLCSGFHPWESPCFFHGHEGRSLEPLLESVCCLTSSLKFSQVVEVQAMG